MSSHEKVALPKVGVFNVISSVRPVRVRDDVYLDEIETLLGSEEPLCVSTAEGNASQQKRFFSIFFLLFVVGIFLPSLIGPESRVARVGGPDDRAANRASPEGQSRQAAQDGEKADVLEGRSTAERMLPARGLKPAPSPSTQ